MERLQSSSTLALAVILIAGGAVLFFFQFFGGGIGHYWQIFIVVPGAALLFAAARTEWSAPLTIAGAVVIGVGAILFVQDLYDYYRSWAYAWTLLPALAGAALLHAGSRRNDEHDRSKGRALMLWSLAGFVVLAALFELMLFDGGSSWGRYLVPLMLIGVGGFILFKRATRPEGNSDRTTQADDRPASSGGGTP